MSRVEIDRAYLTLFVGALALIGFVALFSLGVLLLTDSKEEPQVVDEITTLEEQILSIESKLDRANSFNRRHSLPSEAAQPYAEALRAFYSGLQISYTGADITDATARMFDAIAFDPKLTAMWAAVQRDDGSASLKAFEVFLLFGFWDAFASGMSEGRIS